MQYVHILKAVVLFFISNRILCLPVLFTVLPNKGNYLEFSFPYKKGRVLCLQRIGTHGSLLYSSLPLCCGDICLRQ
jgi:hypothetical protein